MKTEMGIPVPYFAVTLIVKSQLIVKKMVKNVKKCSHNQLEKLKKVLKTAAITGIEI